MTKAKRCPVDSANRLMEHCSGAGPALANPFPGNAGRRWLPHHVRVTRHACGPICASARSIVRSFGKPTGAGDILDVLGNHQILVRAQTWAKHSIWLPASTTALRVEVLKGQHDVPALLGDELCDEVNVSTPPKHYTPWSLVFQGFYGPWRDRTLLAACPTVVFRGSRPS
jgi:hypothetical protein